MSDILKFPGKPNKKSGRKPGARLPVLYLLCLMILAATAARLIQIQGVQAQQFGSRARAQRSQSLEIAPDRGKIFDRNGEILAISVEKDSIFAEPYQMKKKDKRRAAREIARVLKEDTRSIYEKLTQDSGFVYLRRKADRKTADKIKNIKINGKKIEGVRTHPESERHYPGKSLAAHILGFVGLDNIGLAGLELQFDKELKGRPGALEMEQDRFGRPIPWTRIKSKPPTPGRALALTIDKAIQYKAQVELKKAVKEADASAGWIIVMDSRTGEIYAMASEPTYDLNKFSEADAQARRDRLITDVYEPGSTMKIVTAAAALEEGLYTPGSAFTLPGTLRVGGYTIGEAHSRGTEAFTFSTIVERSSNIGAVTLGQALGKDRLYEYAAKFGMNSFSGINMPGEGQGFLPTPDQWSASTLATVSFGQGISATALENIRAVNVIASGGRLVEPKLVQDIIDSNQTTRAIKKKPKEAKRVISERTAKTMSEILHRAVENGTGGEAKIPGYTVAGKTGTAKKVRKDGPGYEPGKYVSSFIGFTPVREPTLTILVAIDEPNGAYYGGVVAAPAFTAVGEYALRQLRIAP